MKKLIKNCRRVAVLLPVVLLAAGCGGAKEEMTLDLLKQQEEQAEIHSGEQAGMEGAGESSWGTLTGETSAGKALTGAAMLSESLLVHVCGAVSCPGVYELSEGDRVLDAVKAAGGFSEDAVQDALNLAQEVEDGSRIRIPTESEAESGSQAFWPSEDDGKINLNTAGTSELTSLSGIGESRAEDILSYRQEHGPFQFIEEIKNVPGIKDTIFEKIKDDITV